MLPARSRLRRSRDITEVVSRGVRAGGRRLVVHLDRRGDPSDPPTAGFVVSKAVGGSVVRHAVVRRLRAQLTPLLDRLPPGSRVVVRALAAAAEASSDRLGRDLEDGLRRALDAWVRTSAAAAAPVGAGAPGSTA